MSSVKGFILLELTAYDTTLEEEVHKTWTYQLPNDLSLRSRFENVLIPPPPDKNLPAVPCNTKHFDLLVRRLPTIDMTNFHSVVLHSDLDASQPDPSNPA